MKAVFQIAGGQIPQFQESRSATIVRHISNYLSETAATREAYADDVRQQLARLIPVPELRVIRFHELEEHYGNAPAMLKANDQLLKRVLEGSVKFPADLEEACVLALPESRRLACARELSARYDMVAAPSPKAASAVLDFARLLSSTGDLVATLAPMMADGKIDADDAPLAKKAIQRINAAQGELAALSAQIAAILPDVGVR